MTTSLSRPLCSSQLRLPGDPHTPRASFAKVNSFLKDETSPTRIARLKKIVNLLVNAQPWDAGSPHARRASLAGHTFLEQGNDDADTLQRQGKYVPQGC